MHPRATISFRLLGAQRWRGYLGVSLLAVGLVVTLQTARAHARPPLLAEIRRFASNAASTQDNGKRRGQFEFLTMYLPAKISRYEDRCEYKAELQVLLIRAHLELDDERAARKAAIEMMRDYRASNPAREFTRWLTYKVQDCRARGKKRWVGLFEEVAKELNIELQDPRKLLSSADWDGDGIPNNGQERCTGYRDDRDEDRDGVPDACDLCWGFPDDLDEDRDGYKKGWQVVPVQVRPRYVGSLEAIVADIRGDKKPDRSLDHELVVQETVLRAAGTL